LTFLVREQVFLHN